MGGARGEGPRESIPGWVQGAGGEAVCAKAIDLSSGYTRVRCGTRISEYLVLEYLNVCAQRCLSQTLRKFSWSRSISLGVVAAGLTGV